MVTRTPHSVTSTLPVLFKHFLKQWHPSLGCKSHCFENASCCWCIFIAHDLYKNTRVKLHIILRMLFILRSIYGIPHCPQADQILLKFPAVYMSLSRLAMYNTKLKRGFLSRKTWIFWLLRSRKIREARSSWLLDKSWCLELRKHILCINLFLFKSLD
jgi:hypothetical protein